jgi:quercetin dioxygenase-like cupin family protein
MDHLKFRVARVEIQPGAVRSVHTHDDVRYHLWVPVSGKLEITIGSSKPAAPASGQAFFIEKGAPHGFQNVGDTPAAALEIFVKDGASAAKIQALGVTPGALAKP